MRIAVNGVRLYFDVEGASLVPDGPRMRQRPTVILLHGGPGFDHTAFKPALSPLAEEAQLIYLDHRGMGRSDSGDPGEWTLSTWASDLLGFCDALEIERPVLFGQSFGGFVAMQCAVQFGERLGGLILSSTAARNQPDRIFSRFQELGGSEARTAAEAFFKRPDHDTWAAYEELAYPWYNVSPRNPHAKHRRIFRPEVLFHFWRTEFLALDFREALAGIRTPTLVLAGDKDPITPPDAAAEIAEAVPSDFVSYRLVADAGHGVFRDRPDTFLSTVREFLLGIPLAT